MIKGIIFDMDGVIADTQWWHSQVESDVLSELGVEISAEQLTDKYAGSSDSDLFAELLGQEKNSDLVKKAVEMKWLRMETDRVEIKAMPGLLELLSVLEESGILIGLASGSPVKFIERVLEILKIKSFFGAIVSADQVEKGKPAPDVFLRAAQIMGLQPRKCVVIEDGKNGMIGARVAGMKVIALIKEMAIKSEYPADLVVNNLAEVYLNLKNLEI